MKPNSLPHAKAQTKSPSYVGKRALYGLPQAPRLWNNRLTEWLLAQGFVQCDKDKCVFKYSKDGSVILLIVYVDDLAFAGNDDKLIAEFKKQLSDPETGFSMKDLGTLKWFLGMHVEHVLEGVCAVSGEAGRCPGAAGTSARPSGSGALLRFQLARELRLPRSLSKVLKITETLDPG